MPTCMQYCVVSRYMTKYNKVTPPLGRIDMKSSTHDVVTAVTTVLRGLDKATANGKYLPTEINRLGIVGIL